MIALGLPAVALRILVGELPFLIEKEDLLSVAVGVSRESFYQYVGGPDVKLGVELSNRIWKFAETMASASEVFGSKEEALGWMALPAIGLDQRRPIDLFSTAAGQEVIEEYLTRIEYGVYT